MLHDVNAVLTFDTLLQWIRIVVLILLHLIDEVVCRTVTGNGVGGSNDANVLISGA